MIKLPKKVSSPKQPQVGSRTPDNVGPCAKCSPLSEKNNESSHNLNGIVEIKAICWPESLENDGMFIFTGDDEMNMKSKGCKFDDMFTKIIAVEF